MADLVNMDYEGGMGYEGGKHSMKECSIVCNMLCVVILLAILYCCWTVMCQYKHEGMSNDRKLIPDYDHAVWHARKTYSPEQGNPMLTKRADGYLDSKEGGRFMGRADRTTENLVKNLYEN
jgi:hypothetical protein